MNRNKQTEVLNLLLIIKPDYAESFKKAISKGKAEKWLDLNIDALNQDQRWVMAYPNRETLFKEKSKEKQMIDVYDNIKDLSNMTDAQKNFILSTNDFTLDELKDYYKYREYKAAKEAEEKQKNLDELTARAERSSRDSSDAYTGIFGDQYARKAYLQGDDQLADLQSKTGSFAAATDWAPFPISLAGPILRTVQKQWAEEPIMTKGTAIDFGLGVIPDFIEKPVKTAWNAGKRFLGRFGKVADQTPLAKDIERELERESAEKASREAADKAFDVMEKDLDALSDKELVELFQQTDNPVLKAKIDQYAKARANANAKRATAQMPEVADDLQSRLLAQKEVREADAAVEAANQEWIKAIDEQLPVAELKTGDPIIKPFDEFGGRLGTYANTPIEDLAEFLRFSEKSKPIQTALGLGNIAATGATRKLFNVDKVDNKPVKPISDSDINRVIKDFSGSWRLDRLPVNYDNPVIKAAYDKWRKNAGYTYDAWLTRLGGKK